jgi:hypothetical protein
MSPVAESRFAGLSGGPRVEIIVAGPAIVHGLRGGSPHLSLHLPGKHILSKLGDVDRSASHGQNSSKLLKEVFLVPRTQQTLKTQLAHRWLFIFPDDAVSDGLRQRVAPPRIVTDMGDGAGDQRKSFLQRRGLGSDCVRRNGSEPVEEEVRGLFECKIMQRAGTPKTRTVSTIQWGEPYSWLATFPFRRALLFACRALESSPPRMNYAFLPMGQFVNTAQAIPSRNALIQVVSSLALFFQVDRSNSLLALTIAFNSTLSNGTVRTHSSKRLRASW